MKGTHFVIDQRRSVLGRNRVCLIHEKEQGSWYARAEQRKDVGRK